MEKLSSLDKINLLEKCIELYNNTNNDILAYIEIQKINKQKFFNLIRKKLKYNNENIYFYKKFTNPYSWNDEEFDAIFEILGDVKKIELNNNYKNIVLGFSIDVNSIRGISKVLFADYLKRKHNNNTYNTYFSKTHRWRKNIALMIITYKYMDYIQLFDDKLIAYYQLPIINK